MTPSSDILPRLARRSIHMFVAGILLFWASMYVYVPTLPVYAESSGANLGVVGLAVGMYGFTQMLARIPVGIWSDSSGKRRVFVVIGMVICGLAAAGLALAPDPFWIIVFRGVMGLAAATWVCSTVLFTSYFPGRDPALPLSIMSFAGAFGQVVGTASGGIIAEHWGWTAPFWASFFLSLLGALVLSLPPDDTTARPVTTTPQSMARIARAPLLLLACGIGILSYFAAYSTVYGFTPIWAERLGASRSQLGYLTTMALISYSAITMLTPRFVRWLGEWRTIWLGLGLLAAGILPIPFCATLGPVYALQFVSGLGRGLLYPLLMSLSIKAVKLPDRASAMGIFQASYALGMFAGPSLSGGIAEAYGLPVVFWLCGGLCIAALLLTVSVSFRRTFIEALRQPTG